MLCKCFCIHYIKCILNIFVHLNFTEMSKNPPSNNFLYFIYYCLYQWTLPNKQCDNKTINIANKSMILIFIKETFLINQIYPKRLTVLSKHTLSITTSSYFDFKK